MLPRLYLDLEITCPSNLLLPPNLVQHIHVLRCKLLQEIILFNGRGGNYLAQIVQMDKRLIEVKVLAYNPSPPPIKPTITLALSIIANDKMNLIIQKATELGVDKINLLFSSYSQKFKSERIENRLTNLKNIAISSAMQCNRDAIPFIASPLKYEEFLVDEHKTNNLNNGLKVIMSTLNSNDAFKQLDKANNIEEIIFLVGPEGGFSFQEENLAIQNGYAPLHLGNLILRSETAAISGLVVLNTLFRNFIV
jgi:16S rRNA (uracil1498-N3)-methyltransferase